MRNRFVAQLERWNSVTFLRDEADPFGDCGRIVIDANATGVVCPQPVYIRVSVGVTAADGTAQFSIFNPHEERGEISEVRRDRLLSLPQQVRGETRTERSFPDQ